MRLLTPPKLGLIVLVVIALLGAATRAQADPGATVTDIQPVPTASGGVPMATPPQAPGAIAATVNEPIEGRQEASQSTSGQPSASATPATSGQPSASATPATNASPVEQSSHNSVTADQTVPAISGDASSKSASPDPGPVPGDTSGSAGSTAPMIDPVTAATPSGDQTVTPPPAGDDETGLPSGSSKASAPESNTTTQMIWQIQISGCRFQCVGTSQIQTAVQQNTTVQVVPAPLPVSAISITPAGAGGGATPISAGPSASSGGPSQITSNITQVQLGCLQYCFGSTTLSTPNQPRSQTAVDLLLGELGELFPPTPTPTSAIDANVIDQTTTQFEDGRGLEGGQGIVVGQAGPGGQTAPVLQSQSATQTAATVQILPPSLSSELDATGLSDFSPGETLNQTDQGIWQLQIGCVFDCFQTQQDQQAEQANNSIQVVLPVPGSAAPTASAANNATAIIWQFQIGCLFWCYDAAELQTAASYENSVVLVGSPPASALPISGSGPATSQQTPPAGSSSPRDPASSNATSIAGTPPLVAAIMPPSNRPIAASASQAPTATGIAAPPLPAVSSIRIARFTRGTVGAASLAAASTTLNTESHSAPDSPRVRPAGFPTHTAGHQAHRRSARHSLAPTSSPVTQAAVSSSGAGALGWLLLLLAAAVAVYLVGAGARDAVRNARRFHD